MRTATPCGKIGAWSIAPTILPALYVCAGPRAGALSRSEGRSARKGATVPTAIPALPLPALAEAVEAAGELDRFASAIRELGEQEHAQLDEEATRRLIEFARGLRLASVRLMTDATTIEEVATRLYGDYEKWGGEER